MFITPNSAAVGISYSFWLRMRWIVAGMAICVVVLAIAVQLSSVAMFIALFGTFALCSGLVPLLTIFTLGPADLGARGSGYPKNMLPLPVRTRSLVGWPMLIGTVSMALMWMLIALLVLRPAGLLVPRFWPAAMGAAAVAWLQAVGWAPFPSPFVRVPVLAVAFTPLVLLGSLGGLYLESNAVSATICVGSLVWIGAAYLFAIRGLSLTRAGSDGEWPRIGFVRTLTQLPTNRILTAGVHSPFKSASTAQLWHEIRRNAISLPLMLSFVSLPMFVIVVHAVIDGDARKNLVFSSLTLSPAILGLASLVSMFLFFSGLYGPGMGKFDIWGKEQIPGFFAVRPMTTPRFVLVKMAGAAISVLMAWCLLLVLMLIWAVLESSSLNPNASVVRTAFHQASWRDFIALPLVLIGPLVFSWRNMCAGMWSCLAGRKWLAHTIGFGTMFLIAIAGLSGHWLYAHREFVPVLLTYLPWLLGLLLLLKLAAASWMFRELQRCNLATSETTRKSLLLWGAICIGLLAVAGCFVKLTPTLAVGTIFAVPLVRIGAAPLCLHWNRHR
jgi:hypothetical protein